MLPAMPDDTTDGVSPAAPDDRTRRQLLGGALGALLLAVTPRGQAATSLLAVRVWPSQDYTRLTLESNGPLQFQHFLVEGPDRLVVDLTGLEFNRTLEEIQGKVGAGDPFIKSVRAGRNRPGVTRLVVELKQTIKPQVFALAPAGNYGHRLVIDLYSTHQDSLMALLDDSQRPRAAERTPEPNPAEEAEHGRQEPMDREKLPVDRMITVVIDPGHGGEDPGAVGASGSYEKTVVLAISKRLKRLLESEPGMRVVLTRSGDFFVPLGARVAKARAAKADLFVSVHADAFIRPDARGSSVFALSESGATSTAAKWLAQKENDADLIGGVSLPVKDRYLARTLLDLTQTATISDSLKLGKHVLGELGHINRLHKRDVEQAGFAVLKAPDIPSILIETAFISNPEEEQRLTDEDYQEKMAKAIVKGLRTYLAKNPPLARSRLARS